MENLTCQTPIKRKINSKIRGMNINPSSTNKGFALILLLILMPLVLASISFLYIAMTQIEIASVLHQTCRKELLESQESSAKLLQTLMLFNKTNTQFHHNLLTLYLNNKHKQINQGREFLLEVLNQLSIKTKKWILISNIEIQSAYNSSELPVELHIDNSGALSFYKLKPHFQEIEKQAFHWSYQLQTIPPLSQWAPWVQKFDGHCTTTLKKESPWNPILIADKFS